MNKNEVESFLAGIRKTITDSEKLIESARLRIAETDRMLASQGLTREQVLTLEFTPEQRLRVNEELRRLGLPPVEDGESRDFDSAADELSESVAGGDEVSFDERSRRFGDLMHGFRL